MHEDGKILREIQVAFDSCRRPTHFTNYMHCPECAEHDALLLSRNNDSLQIEDVGDPGWDPLCYVEPAGFGYFFPGLARLALSGPSPAHDWYGPQLLFHLTDEGTANRHLLGFTPGQRRAVAKLLKHITETRAILIGQYLCYNELSIAVGLWAVDD